MYPVRQDDQKPKIIAMTCYMKNEQERREYKKCMLKICNEIVLFPLAEQKFAEQVRVIKTNGYLSKLEINEIKRNIHNPQ